MIAVNYSTARNNFKSYCDCAVEEKETIIITRKGDKNVVLVSMDEWNEMLKAIRNAEYLAKLDKGFKELHSGKGTAHELIED